jgi:hypothetical protein
MLIIEPAAATHQHHRPWFGRRDREGLERHLRPDSSRIAKADGDPAGAPWLL